MVQCDHCRTELPSTARFCPTCGMTTANEPEVPTPPAPATTSPHATVTGGRTARRSTAPIIMTLAVLVALVGGGFLVVNSRDGGDGAGDGGRAGATTTAGSTVAPTSPPESTTSGPTSVPSTTTTSLVETTIATTAPPPPDPNVVALEGLATTIEEDRPAVDAHLDRWVPQISAKRAGLEWEGVNYDLAGILALHRQLDAQYGALLVNGAEYVFRLDDNPMEGWFITIVDESHPTPDGALDWCRANAIDRENCAAKLITNDQLVTRTLVLQ